MKLSVTQPLLSKALGIVSRAVSSRTTLPVLGNILLEAKDGRLRVAATNREIGINCWIAAAVQDDGAITIPARLLAEFVNSLPPERIDLELTERTQTLHLSCARFDANMKGIDANEFPLLPTMAAQLEIAQDGATRVQLPPDELRTMINQVTFAASTDENRPTLTGVEVTLQVDRVQMAATDGYRLSVRRLAIDSGPAEKATVIVPARSLSELARIAADADEAQPVQAIVTPSRNQVLFALAGKGADKDGVESVEMVCELIDARFPDYMATVPKTCKTVTIVDTDAFLKAVKVALLFARDNANIIRFAMHPSKEVGKLVLSATSGEIGDNVSELQCIVEGDPVEIAFNGRYLVDALSHIDAPNIALETTVATRPGMIKPGDDSDYFQVLMPMHPQQGAK